MTRGEFLVLLAIEAVGGAASGIALVQWMRSGTGWPVGLIAGGIGGLGLAWLAGLVPWLGRFVGHVEAAADATLRATGGLTPTVLVGAGVAGVLGGLVSAGAAGLVVQRSARS